MLINKQQYHVGSLIHKPENRFIDISVMAIICYVMLVGLPSTLLVVILLSVGVTLLCIKNYYAVIIGFCIGGGPLTSLWKSVYDYSITKLFICVIILQLILIFVDKQPALKFDRNKCYRIFLLWSALIFFFIFINFIVAPKSNYNIYYIQYFFVYSTAAILAGLLAVNKKLAIEDILLPIMLFFSCAYPVFSSTVLNIAPAIQESSVGTRALEGIGCLKLGRLSGSLIVLAFFILWKNIQAKKDTLLFCQIALAFIICFPMLWYSQTRQSMIAALLTVEISMIFLMLFNKKRTLWQSLFWLSIAVFVFWGSYSFLEWARDNLAQMRLQTRFADTGRFYKWQEALDGIYTNPIIGYGLGGYYSHYGIWAHNWVLEVWYDFGVIGVMLFCGPIATILTKSYSALKDHVFWPILGAYWVIVAQVSGDIPRNPEIFFFFTVSYFHGEMQGDFIKASHH